MKAMLKSVTLALLAGSTLLAHGTLGEPAAYESGEEFPGGDTTVGDDGRNAFSHPAANLSVDRQTPFFIGNSFFKKNWVEAPASTTGRDGLGPYFITRACAGCHALDGRGAPPTFEQDAQTEQPIALLVRLSIPGDGGRAGVVPEPTYGTQLNNFAVRDITPEGKIEIRYREIKGQFADGTPYSLRQPEYRITALGYGALHPQTMMSPRIAPHVIGLGLLEAVKEDDILANAARQAKEGKGISGRPNHVWDAHHENWVLGRFGWKANVGSVAHQTAAAFNGDLGITSTLFPHEECMPAQTDCHKRIAQETLWRQERKQAAVDIDDRALGRTVFYMQTLAVPQRRNVKDPQVLRGKRIFHEANCASCHTPRYVTGDLPDFPELSKQTIYPYTDLLLHDMGEGLTDNRPDFEASGREWRTPPLWGLGLIPTVNGHSTLLHDGRARNLMEAVLWHGGEAESAKQHVLELDKADREALIRFLESL